MEARRVPVHVPLTVEEVPVPDNTPEEEALLFGTGENPVGQRPNPFAAFGAQGVPTSTPATSSQKSTAPGGGSVGESLVVEMLRVMQQQQRQQEAMMDQYRKQLFVAWTVKRREGTMPNLRLLRLKPRQKPRRHLHRVTRSSPRLRQQGVLFLPQAGGYVSNRADKYLPQLPVIARHPPPRRHLWPKAHARQLPGNCAGIRLDAKSSPSSIRRHFDPPLGRSPRPG